MDMFSEEDLESINSILDIRKPDVLVEGLEAFVGLLRNKLEVKNVDVQLYLEDYEKLRFKMEYLDGSTLDLNAVKRHEKALKEVKDRFNNDEDASPYVYIIEFGLAFAEYAQAALASSSVAKQIKELSREIDMMVIETTKFERICEFYNNNDAVDFYAHAGQRSTGGNAPEFATISKPAPVPQVQTT